MPIYTPNTGGRTDVPAAETPKILPDEYRHSLVTSQRVNNTSLLSNVTGIPIVVDYYRQHLGASEESVGLQLDDINTYQSYELIHRLILKFESKPSYSFDPETAQSTEDGTAWVMADLAPIVNDMFVRDIGDGRAGLYQITEQPELRSYAAEKVYLITFKLLSIMDAAIDANLLSKVVKNYYYSKDSVLSGGNALLTKENYDVTRALLGTLPAMISKLYSIAYFNPEETIVLMAELSDVIYDEQLVRFLNMVVPLEALDRIKPIKLINLQVGVDFNYNASQNVYDAILKGNKELLAVAPRVGYLYQRTQFIGTRFYGNPGFTKIGYFIAQQKMQYNGTAINSIWGTVNTIIPDTTPQDEVPSYFSDGFFNGVPANAFEKLTYDFFFNGIRDREGILSYIESAYSLPDKDYVYQVGVLIAMVQICRRVLIGD